MRDRINLAVLLRVIVRGQIAASAQVQRSRLLGLRLLRLLHIVC
jgi:hypothetical protein